MSDFGEKTKPRVSRRLPADIPTFVVSYGGTGSKMLLKWLYPDESPIDGLLAAHSPDVEPLPAPKISFRKQKSAPAQSVEW